MKASNSILIILIYVQDGSKLIEKIGSNITTTTTASEGQSSSLSYNYGTAQTAKATTTNDDFGRTDKKAVTADGNAVYTQNYTYKDISSSQTTEQVSEIKNVYVQKDGAVANTSMVASGNIGGIGLIVPYDDKGDPPPPPPTPTPTPMPPVEHAQVFSYQYDILGNITQIKRDGTVATNYQYDEAGQLIRVDDAEQNKSITYTYNVGGNIAQTTEYAYTTGTLGTATKTIPYVYGDSNWPDKLTSYNGKAITYDSIGNPTSYNGWDYYWEGGRQLKTAETAKGGVSYTYNDKGIRTSKIDFYKTNFTLRDSKVVAQETNGNYIYFRYGDDDKLLSINYQGSEYFYLKNLQGDITGIVDELGYLVVEYTYDAWGNQLSCTGTMASSLGVANPFRYRSYYFDVETGLYYLQSRYYNPQWGRFLNADDQFDDKHVLGTNLFVYCKNSPVIHYDSDGQMAAAIPYIETYIGPAIEEMSIAVTKALVQVGVVIGAGKSLAMVNQYYREVKRWGIEKVTQLAITAAVSYGLAYLKSKVPSKLKDKSGRIKTPDSAPDEYQKIKKTDSYRHNKTKWKATPAKPNTQHGGPHWDMSPPSGKGHINVGPDGNIFGGSL